MCGLFGVYAGSSLAKDEIDAFVELGYLSSTRGLDSTGVLRCNRKGEKGFQINSEKDAANPVSFLSRFSTQKFIRDKNPLLLMGHARAATIGDVNKHNAQPVLEGKIFGCHNGTIGYYAPSSKESLKNNTDSRELFKAIDKQGVVKALSKTSTGAYALTWVDTQKRTLNFLRNNERELWLVKSKAQSLYWASEWRFLSFFINEYGGWDRYEKPYLLAKHEMQSLELGNHIGTMVSQNIDSDISKEWSKSYTSVPWTREGASVPLLPAYAKPSILFCTTCRWSMNKCKCPTGQLKKFIRPPDPKMISADGWTYDPDYNKSVVPYTVEKYLGFERKPYTLTQAKTLLDTKCVGCKNVFDWEAKVYWFGEKEYVCKDCRTNDPVIAEDLKKVKIYGSANYVERVN